MPVMFAILFILFIQWKNMFSIEIMSSMGSFKQIVHD